MSIATKPIQQCGHLDIPYQGRGLCRQCYMAAHRNGTLSNYSSSKRERNKPNECGHPDRSHYAHGMCLSCYQIKRRQTIPEQRRKHNSQQSNWRTKNGESYKEKQRHGHLMRSFGITLDDYNKMRHVQEDRCAICDKPELTERSGKVRQLAVDHCHKKTERNVRGLLCYKCNQMIGLAGDNPEILLSAIQYLQISNGMPTKESA